MMNRLTWWFRVGGGVHRLRGIGFTPYLNALRLPSLAGVLLLIGACSPTPHTEDDGEETSYDGPIIDVHLHAYEQGAPFYLCIPWMTQFPAWDGQGEWEDVFFQTMTEPDCPDPIPPVSAEGGALMEATLAAMEAHNIVGVLSASPAAGRAWRDAAPDRFLPSLEFRLGRDDHSPEDMRVLLESGDFVAIGEISNQYGGISPDDERMSPYWALAEEFDIPVAIHMEQGVPGVSLLGSAGFENYRSRDGNPYLLEDVLARHPRLRISVMHYGAPLVDEMIAILNAYPQVYIDLGGMQWYYPKAFFYEHLRRFIDAGLGQRIRSR